MRLVRVAVVVAACVGAAFLTGCSSEGKGPEPSAESWPDRVAEQERMEAYYPRLAECMTGQGFPASWDAAAGEMTVALGPDGEMNDTAAAEAACEEQLGAMPTGAPITAEEIDGLFDLKVDAYECLLAQGFEPAAPPSKESWVAEYPSGNAWEPFENPAGGAENPAGGALFPQDVCKDPDLVDVALSTSR